MNMIHNVSLQNINFSFKQGGIPFFKDLTIDFIPSSINFVCGKNGVGKSTLLKILSGDQSIKDNLQGALFIDNQIYDIQKSDVAMRAVGMVLQDFNAMLVHAYSFRENLQFARLPHFPSFKMLSEMRQLPQFVEKYGINTSMPIARLSGGQRQILSILMVLQRSPKVLLLDEPTAALDEENASIVMNFLQDLSVQENITIVAIVHDLELVRTYAPSTYFQLYQEDGIRKVRTIAI